MRAFFINMDRDADRLAHMQAQANKLGMAFRRVPAVAAADLEAGKVPHYRPHRFSATRWEIGALEQAVFLSHRRAWAEILASGDEYAIVMEDDLVFRPGFSERVAAILAAPKAVDIVRLNTSAQARQMGPALALAGADAGAPAALRRIYYDMADAGCYLLSCRACEALLAQSEEFCDHLDDFVFSPARRLLCYQLDPPYAGQVIHEEDLRKTWQDKGQMVSIRDSEGARRVAKGPVLYRLFKELKRMNRAVLVAWRGAFRGAQVPDIRSISER